MIAQISIRISLRIFTQLYSTSLFRIPGQGDQTVKLKVCIDTHQINYSNVIPALHYWEKRDEHGDNPAASQHQRDTQRGHLIPVNQRLAADGIVPGEAAEWAWPRARRSGREGEGGEEERRERQREPENWKYGKEEDMQRRKQNKERKRVIGNERRAGSRGRERKEETRTEERKK